MEHEIVQSLPLSNLLAKRVTAAAILRSSHPHLWIPAIALTAFSIFVLDIATGPQISIGVFYLIPISLATWRFKRRAGIMISFLCSIAWGYVAFFSGGSSSAAVTYWNAMTRLGYFLSVTFALSALCESLQQSRTDSLIGLLNPRGFCEQAVRELARCQREGRGLSLAYFDIDDFKEINDRLGHRFGDAVLRRIGAAIARSVRRSDIAARLGGDEFVVLFPEADYSAAQAAVHNLRTALDRALADIDFPVTFSIGVATCDIAPESLDWVLHKANALLYFSKRNGKNRVFHKNVNPSFAFAKSSADPFPQTRSAESASRIP